MPDNNRVNIVSLLASRWWWQSPMALLLPLVVLIPIECAIINTALPYIYGQRTMYLGFIIVGCIQLGATIDYSILLTGNYLTPVRRAINGRLPSARVTVSAESILTSGLIIMTVAYGLFFLLTSVEAVSGLGN